MQDPTPLSHWQMFLTMIRRDFPWLVVSLLLLLLLMYSVLLSADHENVCDARYKDFVIACYEATGYVPTNAAYNLSAFGNFSFEERIDGERYTTAPEARNK